jgi:hypothetical protein
VTTLTDTEQRLREARETLASLIDKRALADHRFVELDAERTRVSFAAHTGEPRARKALDDVLRVMARHDGETRSLDAAVAEAQRRVAEAETAHRTAEEAERARQALALLADLRDLGARLDAAAKDLVDGYSAFQSCYRSIRSLGVKHPEPEIFRIACRNSIIAALMHSDLGLHRDPPAFIPPGQRHSFEELLQGWGASIEGWCSQRLPAPAPTDTTEKEAA